MDTILPEDTVKLMAKSIKYVIHKMEPSPIFRSTGLC